MSRTRTTLFRAATSPWVERAARAAPGGERAAWRAASRYVAGRTAAEARAVAARLAARGIASSLDQFGELVDDAAVARRVTDDYVALAAGLGTQPAGVWLSVDLSHLGLDVDAAAATAHLAAIAAALPAGRVLQVGAEDGPRLEAIAQAVLTVAGQGLAERLGATVQANERRAPDDARRFAAAGVHVRLVKGAYVQPHAGLAWGEPTDLAFLRLAEQLAGDGARFALATHDAVLREALFSALGPRECEQLLGVRPDMLNGLVARGVPVRVYVPFGEDWFRFWMRRLAESRGA